MTVRDLVATMENKEHFAISWYVGQFTFETDFWTCEPHNDWYLGWEDPLDRIPTDVLNRKVRSWTLDENNLFISIE